MVVHISLSIRVFSLGRARAIRSQGGAVGKDQALQAAKDYQKYLRLSSREDWDTDQEMEEDGAARNPFAAWEWGSSLRQAGMYEKAAEVHTLAAVAFEDIGDKPRSIISSLDAGIDLAAAGNSEEAKSVLQRAIQKTTLAEGRDVELLQRVIAKEGEARLAYASILWDTKGDRAAAETQLGDACIRLEQLDADAQARIAKLGLKPSAAPDRLKFSIDDGIGAFDISCSKFKYQKFLTETLQWPESLQKKVNKLQSLGT
jgi:tetratricopeptide (TPR) repeat protein